jgi:hypothetical protein
MVEILTLWSPHKLLKNIGVLSEYRYAKCSQKVPPKQKKFEILTLHPGHEGMVKITISRNCPSTGGVSANGKQGLITIPEEIS